MFWQGTEWVSKGCVRGRLSAANSLWGFKRLFEHLSESSLRWSNILWTWWLMKWSATTSRQAVTFKVCSVGTKEPTVVNHHQQPEPWVQGRTVLFTPAVDWQTPCCKWVTAAVQSAWSILAFLRGQRTTATHSLFAVVWMILCKP